MQVKKAITEPTHPTLCRLCCKESRTLRRAFTSKGRLLGRFCVACWMRHKRYLKYGLERRWFAGWGRALRQKGKKPVAVPRYAAQTEAHHAV
jgi:hypothetical protein